MDRREFLSALVVTPLLSKLVSGAPKTFRRVRPGEALWPNEAAWATLRSDVGGRLIKLESPLAACKPTSSTEACGKVLKSLENPYYISDEPAYTQASGYLDAWTSAPSAYAVAAESTQDVVAAVNFAREKNLRLVVKGGGHSYLGTSSSPDSLLIWTHRMNKITMHDSFIASGCKEAQPAVTIETGAIWQHTYNEVTTKAGRYVQGGGCATVGVAGLIQSGGFGSFSKNYGMAAAALIEAEIVTADGKIRIVNACKEPELFWALKGGGGGTFGVVTKVTLRTRELPAFFGGAFANIRATSDDAFRRLIAGTMKFYKEALFNPHWGEQMVFRSPNRLDIRMVFCGLDQKQAEEQWVPFKKFLAESPGDFLEVGEGEPRIHVGGLEEQAHSRADPGIGDYPMMKTVHVVARDNTRRRNQHEVGFSGDLVAYGQLVPQLRPSILTHQQGQRLPVLRRRPFRRNESDIRRV